MKERPTPETDALIRSKDGFGATNYEWRDHSRRLERERDEAREDLEFRRGLYKVQEEYLEDARRERDEAREKYFAMRDLHTNATELAEKYKRERDEARRGIRLMAQNAELWKERADEAREALRKAKRFVEAFEPRSLGAEVDQNETFNIIRKILEAVE